MTDAHDAKAQEIAERYDLVCLVGPGVTCHEHTLCDCHVLDIIATALRDCERKKDEEIRRLREALEPFAAFEKAMAQLGSTSPKTGAFYVIHAGGEPVALTVEDFKAARAALNQKE
jgi:hypothetical protein